MDPQQPPPPPLQGLVVPPAPSQPADVSMQLSMEELQWAHQIRDAINNSEDLTRPVSDMECAQWAIVTMERQEMQEVLDRAYKYQCFHEEYRLQGNSVPEGMDLIRGYFQLLPDNILSIDYMPQHAHYLLVFDYAMFHPKAVTKTLPTWRTFMGAMGYLLHLMNSSLQTTREGIAMIGECEGMGFHNYDAQLEERFMNELFNYYPLRHRESLWLRTPTVANMIYACLKPFMRPDLQRRFHLGCQLEGYEGRIDKLFQMPTPDIARQHLLQRLEGYLQSRVHNQTTYVLPSITAGLRGPVHIGGGAVPAANPQPDEMSHDGDIIFDDDLIGHDEDFEHD